VTLRRGVLLSAVAAGGVGCMTWVDNCFARATCTAAPTEQWLPLLLAAAGPVVAILLVLCFARAGYLLWRTNGRLAEFGIVRAPEKLQAAMRAAGVDNVRCLGAVRPLAFCSGVLNPRIYVTTGLQEALSSRELQAVLQHEEHHRRSRHPLLRAMLIASAEVMFFFPVAGWFAERLLDDAELAADRAAIRRLGHRTVASALWRVGSPTGSARGIAVGFDGVAELRAAQLLGESLPARRPSTGQWIQSLVGIAIVLEASLCASSAVVSGIL